MEVIDSEIRIETPVEKERPVAAQEIVETEVTKSKDDEPLLVALVKKPKIKDGMFSKAKLKFIGLLLVLLLVQTGFLWFIKAKVKNHQLVFTISTTLIIFLFGIGLAVFFVK